MEDLSEIVNSNARFDDLARCPICFNKFLSAHIQVHASTCNGRIESIDNSQSLEKKELLNMNNRVENDKTGKKPIASFFKTLSERKRLTENDITEASPVNACKKSKIDVGSIESEKHSSTIKTPSKSVRQPLADVMRPSTLEQYKGQEKVIGNQHGGFWRRMIESISKSYNKAIFPSMIIWGPPGCGKTSLANVISSEVSKSRNGNWRFTRLSACNSGISQVKSEVTCAKNERNLFKRSTMLFIDEIHRFNKTQQDALLPHVEDGTITLIGATTENPSFSVNSALLSRSRVVVLEKLSPKVVFDILQRALEKLQIKMIIESGSNETNTTYSQEDVFIDEGAITYLSNLCDGDARTALNCLEMSHQIIKQKVAEVKFDKALSTQSSTKNVITIDDIKHSIKRSHVLYDKKGDEHYNCASALQKSIRGSDDSASLYWLMRMFEGGEDPLYIARRLVRTASEDVGLGDPNALGVAVAAMQGCQLIGRPECDIILAQCTTYLARAKKSHEVYNAMNKAKKLIRESEDCKGIPPVPLHLRNATSSLGCNLGFGSEYLAQDSKDITYMPEEIKDIIFF